MSIIRVEHKQRYAIIANATLQDQNLSWEALGMLAYLLSKPDSWEISPAALQKERNGGRDKIYRILNELIKFGYVKRIVQHNSKGHISYDYLVHETPRFDSPNPCPENPYTENPFTENPYTENQDTILSTEDHKVPIFSGDVAPALVDPTVPPITPPIDPKPPKPAPKPKSKEPKQSKAKYPGIQVFANAFFKAWPHLSFSMAMKIVIAIADSAVERGTPLTDYTLEAGKVAKFHDDLIADYAGYQKMTKVDGFVAQWLLAFPPKKPEVGIIEKRLIDVPMPDCPGAFMQVLATFRDGMRIA